VERTVSLSDDDITRSDRLEASDVVDSILTFAYCEAASADDDLTSRGTSPGKSPPLYDFSIFIALSCISS